MFGRLRIGMRLGRILLQVRDLLLHRAEFGAVIVMLRLRLAASHGVAAAQEHNGKREADSRLIAATPRREGVVTVSTRGLSSGPEIT